MNHHLMIRKVKETGCSSLDALFVVCKAARVRTVPPTPDPDHLKEKKSRVGHSGSVLNEDL